MIHATIVEWVILALVFLMGTWLLASELLSYDRRISLQSRRNKQRNGFADELLYRRLIRPNLIKNANGSYMAMFEIALPSREELDDHGIAENDTGFARALSNFGSSYVLHFHSVHRRHMEYDTPRSYPHPVLAWLDSTRKDWFLTPDRVFASRNILSITWMPPKGALDRMRASLATGLSFALGDEDEMIDEFDTKLADFVANFSAYGKVRRLGTADVKGAECSELLEHLAWCVGGKNQNIRVPIAGQALNGILTEEVDRNPLRIGNQHVRVVVVQALADTTNPLFLQGLDKLQKSYTLVVRFLPDDGHRASKMIRDSLHDWTSKSHESNTFVDPHAEEMIESAREAYGLVASGNVQFGRASIFIVLRESTRKAADQLAHACVAKLSEVSLKSYIASWTAEDDFLATLPADGYHSVRKFAIHALNVTHLFSSHVANSGRQYNGARNLPEQTPAIIYASTPERGQVRVHFSDRIIPDVGHHMGIGGTGMGKSVLLGTVAASFMARFPGAGFTGIDRGRSLYRLTKFLDGNYYDLLGSQSPGFALFSDAHDPDQARAALQIVREMVTLQGVFVDSTIEKSLQAALEQVVGLHPKLRSLTAFYEAIQDPTADSRVRTAIFNYTRKSSQLGNLLDCEIDTFRSSDFNVIEINRLMTLGDSYLIPVLQTLFWKARSHAKVLRTKDGIHARHWLYQIDEAHTLFHNEIGRNFIRDMLKMGRREKYTVGLWSNAAEDFVNSGILNDLTEQCRTRFFFKNSEVRTDADMRAVYGEKLKLSKRGLDRISELAPRHILYSQPKTNEVWELDMALDSAWLAVVGCTDAVDNERVDEYIEEYGDEWKQKLLQHEGVSPEIINRFLQMTSPAPLLRAS